MRVCSLQSCLTLCDPMYCSLPGSSVYGILQAMEDCHVFLQGMVLTQRSTLCLFTTTLTVARQAPLSMGFSRQESWCGLPCPLQEDLPNPGIEPRSPALQAYSLPYVPPGKPIGWCLKKNVMVAHRFLSMKSKVIHNQAYLVSLCAILDLLQFLSHLY